MFSKFSPQGVKNIYDFVIKNKINETLKRTFYLFFLIRAKKGIAPMLLGKREELRLVNGLTSV